MREKVFSLPEVIRRVNADFIPLALNATLVNGVGPAGDENEAQLYGRIRRSQAAPQGVCVLNSGGQVLDWVLMFESDARIVAFLDDSLKHYREYPDGGRPVATRRFQMYPGNKKEEFTDSDTGSIMAAHPKGKLCDAKANRKSRGPEGAVVAQVIGRVLDDSGKPLADTTNQEHYTQDYFTLAPDLQRKVADALKDASGEVRLPDEFGRILATYAYLGHIDVRPLDNPGGRGPGELKECEFRVEKVSKGLWRVRGKTETVGTKSGTGPLTHEVKLAWEGFLEMDGTRMTKLLLSALGTEKLNYGDRRHQGNEVAFLPAGRYIDQNARVRYGIMGTPVPAGEGVAKPGSAPGASGRGGGAPPGLEAKMQRLQEAVQRWQKEGKELSPVGQIMQDFEPFMKAGKLKEAEGVLDRALKLLEGNDKRGKD